MKSDSQFLKDFVKCLYEKDNTNRKGEVNGQAQGHHHSPTASLVTAFCQKGSALQITAARWAYQYSRDIAPEKVHRQQHESSRGTQRVGLNFPVPHFHHQEGRIGAEGPGGC